MDPFTPSEVCLSFKMVVSNPSELLTTFICVLGEYFFELDEKSVMPGYPKLIKDVWGIPGPIDAAFSRMNCEGKSYIFKVIIEQLKSIEQIFVHMNEACSS